MSQNVDADVVEFGPLRPFPQKLTGAARALRHRGPTGAATPASYQANGPGADISRECLFSSALCLLVEKIGNGDQAGSFRLDCLALIRLLDSLDSSKSLMHRVLHAVLRP